MKEEASRWFEQAQKDLESARVNFENSIFYVAAFLSQQAAEKALKAYLIERKYIIRKVHDLHYLGKESGIDQDLLDVSEELSQVYIATRYPDYADKLPYQLFTQEKAEHYIEITTRIIQWVENHI